MLNNKDIAAYSFTGDGLPLKDQKWVKKRFNDYKKNGNFESFSDLKLLEDLVYLEFLSKELKEKIGSLLASETVKENGLLPKTLTEQLDSNLQAQLQVRQKLGLDQEKKSSNIYENMQLLQKKFLAWASENQATRDFPCAHCGQFNRLYITKDSWEAKKHPFFKDKLLVSEPLLMLMDEKKITKKDIATVMNVSEDYIDWVLEKLNRNHS